MTGFSFPQNYDQARAARDVAVKTCAAAKSIASAARTEFAALQQDARSFSELPPTGPVARLVNSDFASGWSAKQKLGLGRDLLAFYAAEAQLARLDLERASKILRSAEKFLIDQSGRMNSGRKTQTELNRASSRA